MNRQLIVIFILFCIVSFPQYAQANAGTPLMWAAGFHLVIGNALIGIGEGILLTWLFSAPLFKSIPLMIIANYFSAWIGKLYICDTIVQKLPTDLNNGWKWFWIMVIATYCMTLILEWPFIALCLRGTQRWLRRSLLASLVLQSVSYALVFGWYWMASGTSLYTKMVVVAPTDMSLPESVFVFFISPTDGNVYKRQLIGRAEEKIFDLHSNDLDDRLYFRANRIDANRWDLLVHNENKGGHVDVLTNLLVKAAPEWPSSDIAYPRIEGTAFNFGKPQRLGVSMNNPWEFYVGYWPVEGLWASNKSTNESVHFSYETPFGAWAVRNAVHLPSDKVLFQLGTEQICVFDPVRRQVALLWHGRGPVPVILQSDIEKGDPTNGNQPIRSKTN